MAAQQVNIIDLHFLNLDHAIGSFLVNVGDDYVLIETGPHSTYEQLCKGLANFGLKPESIRHVLLTHIHFDHAGAAWAFAQAGARIYVHPFGASHLATPEKLVASARLIYKEHMDTIWGQINPIHPDRIQSVNHLEKVKIGALSFTALHTPGHARHHIAWQLGDAIFTGDVAGVKIGNGPVVPPCPPPDINIEEWNQSIDLILAAQPSRLFLTHFGEISHPLDHLQQLRYMLNDWSEWIRERWEKGWQTEELVALFSEYTAAQLRTFGVSELGVRQYEAANPSWMSVSGLIRYWSKKQGK